MAESKSYLENFKENGRLIAQIRSELVKFAQTHHRLEDIDQHARHLIQSAGGEPAFMKVPGYHWATCISVNDVLVHGIPKGYLKNGDLVTIDTGMLYHQTTTDTATSFVIGQPDQFQARFLDLGNRVLEKTIAKAQVGAQIRVLSETMQRGIEKAGFNVTRNLTGHGLGRTMHEPPPIPCFISQDPNLSIRLKAGMILAIEIMYMAGDWPLKTDSDGWTMRTVDGSVCAVFEEDVLITPQGPEILTRPLFQEKTSVRIPPV